MRRERRGVRRERGGVRRLQSAVLDVGRCPRTLLRRSYWSLPITVLLLPRIQAGRQASVCSPFISQPSYLLSVIVLVQSTSTTALDSSCDVGCFDVLISVSFSFLVYNLYRFFAISLILTKVHLLNSDFVFILLPSKPRQFLSFLPGYLQIHYYADFAEHCYFHMHARKRMRKFRVKVSCLLRGNALCSTELREHT